jgi:hypothetical protein
VPADYDGDGKPASAVIATGVCSIILNRPFKITFGNFQMRFVFNRKKSFALLLPADSEYL